MCFYTATHVFYVRSKYNIIKVTHMSSNKLELLQSVRILWQ